MALNDIIQTNVATLPASATVRDAAKFMYEKHVGCLVVVDKADSPEKRPMGIITDRDIVIWLGKEEEIDLNCPIAEIMNPNVVLCTPLDGVYETISKMKNNGIRRIPVVDSKDRLTGIISAADLLRLVGEEIKNISQIISSETAKEMHLVKEIDKNQQMQPQAPSDHH